MSHKHIVQTELEEVFRSMGSEAFTFSDFHEKTSVSQPTSRSFLVSKIQVGEAKKVAHGIYMRVPLVQETKSLKEDIEALVEKHDILEFQRSEDEGIGLMEVVTILRRAVEAREKKLNRIL